MKQDFTDGAKKCWCKAMKYKEIGRTDTNFHPSERPGIAQHRNIAHGHSYLLAVNSRFDYEPEAMDTSLVMVVAMDTLLIGMIDSNINITGSAWIDVGPFNTTTFDKYKLYWTYDIDSTCTLIKESTVQVKDSVLAVWNTFGLHAGEYTLRLTIWDSDGDSLTALRDITLQIVGINEQKDLPVENSFQVYENPCKDELTFCFTLPHSDYVTLKLYDIQGREVAILMKDKLNPGTHSIVFDTKRLTNGVYFCKLNSDEFSQTKKLLLLR